MSALARPDTGSSSTLAALVEAGRLCWPAPAHAAIVRRGEPVPDDERVAGEFLIVPSAQRPRLLVPAGAPAAAAESVRRYSQALSGPERIVRTALTLALRTGVLDRIAPDRMRVTAPLGEAVRSLQDHLGGLLGEPVVLSLGVGTARANRKPVLEAISRSGRPLAFVKLGDHAVTRQLLRDEAAALARLSRNPLPGVQIPRLIQLGEWNGIGLLAQSALSTPPWRTHRRSTLPLDAMRALSGRFSIGRVPLADSPAWQRVLGAAIEDDARARLFARVAEAIGDGLRGVELRHGAWHGDLTPWNLAWVGRQVRVWDWERFAEGVPFGFDPLHYVLALQMVRMPWDQALEATGSLAPQALRLSGVRPSEAGPTYRWYLLELCRRYLLAAAPATGIPMRARADGLLLHLHALVLPGEPSPVLPDWSTS